MIYKTSNYCTKSKLITSHRRSARFNSPCSATGKQPAALRAAATGGGRSQQPPDSHRPLTVWTQPQTLPPADVKVPVTWPDERQESIGCRSNHRTALKLFQ